MKNIFKKLNAGSVILLSSIIIAIVAFIVTIYSNSFVGYQMDNFGTIVLWGVLSLIAGILFLILSYICPKIHLLTDLIGVAFVLFLGLTIRALLLDKQLVFGSVIFSALEQGVVAAEGAAYSGMAALIIYIVASVVAVVATFCQIFKEPEVATNELNQ